MWNRKRTRKSEQTDYTQDNSSHYWQITVNLSWLPLLIKRFTATLMLISTSTQESSPSNNRYRLVPFTSHVQISWGMKTIFNRKLQTRWQFTGEAAQYVQESLISCTGLRKCQHKSVGMSYACVVSRSLSQFMFFFFVFFCKVSWCYTVQDNKKNKEQWHKRDTSKHSRATVKLSRHTKFCWKHHNWNSRYPCSIFHI